MSTNLLTSIKGPPLAAMQKALPASPQAARQGVFAVAFSPHVPQFSSRREFLLKAGGGFGALALASLLRGDPPDQRSTNPLTTRQPHHAARANAVIFLFMEGGPSHV